MRRSTAQLLLAIMCVAGLVAGCKPAQEAKQIEAPVPAPSGPAARNGADGAPPPAMPNGHAPDKVRHHAYDLLSRFDSERPDYGMYTYVLFGYKVGAHAPPLPHDVVQRYKALLEAIESSTGTAADLEAALIPREETNLFCIPAASTAGRPTLDNYDAALALTYRSVALGGIPGDAAFRARLSTAAGPFLVSSLRPLNRIRSAEPMLFADLSAHNPAAMREVVAAYKQRINRSVPDRAESFESLRLDLLTLVLDADDHVKLIKEAVADWRDTLPDP